MKFINYMLDSETSQKVSEEFPYLNPDAKAVEELGDEYKSNEAKNPPASGIAGYTLIYNSHNIRIVSHQPFAGRQEAIRYNHDIANDSLIFERMESRVKIAQTDIGRTDRKSTRLNSSH